MCQCSVRKTYQDQVHQCRILPLTLRGQRFLQSEFHGTMFQRETILPWPVRWHECWMTSTLTWMLNDRRVDTNAEWLARWHVSSREDILWGGADGGHVDWSKIGSFGVVARNVSRRGVASLSVCTQDQSDECGRLFSVYYQCSHSHGVRPVYCSLFVVSQG